MHYFHERMKAIIPVAGAGTKLRPHTYTQPKALIPLAGKTILSIIVDQLKEAGITEFIFIVGYLGDKIKDYVTEKYPDLNAHFVNQNERQGIGHAILLTRKIVGDDEVFIVLGDTICEYDVADVISRTNSVLGIKRVDDPRDFGVAEMGEDGFISRVVEKPQNSEIEYGPCGYLCHQGQRPIVFLPGKQYQEPGKEPGRISVSPMP